MVKQKVEDLDWNNLGFEYRDLPYRYKAIYREGQWQKGELTTDSTLVLSEAAQDLHYGQEVFEGLKAYRRKDGGVNLFRPEMNAQRMANSANRMKMPAYPEDQFVAAVEAVVRAYQEFNPPYESRSSLYLRPFMIGTAPMVCVVAAREL